MLEERLTRGQKICVVLMDIALLTGLTFCIWKSSFHKADMVETFLKMYIPTLIVIIAGFRFLINRLGRRAGQDAAGAKHAPAETATHEVTL